MFRSRSLESSPPAAPVPDLSSASAASAAAGASGGAAAASLARRSSSKKRIEMPPAAAVAGHDRPSRPALPAAKSRPTSREAGFGSPARERGGGHPGPPAPPRRPPRHPPRRVRKHRRGGFRQRVWPRRLRLRPVGPGRPSKRRDVPTRCRGPRDEPRESAGWRASRRDTPRQGGAHGAGGSMPGFATQEFRRGVGARRVAVARRGVGAVARAAQASAAPRGDHPGQGWAGLRGLSGRPARRFGREQRGCRNAHHRAPLFPQEVLQAVVRARWTRASSAPWAPAGGRSAGAAPSTEVGRRCASGRTRAPSLPVSISRAIDDDADSAQTSPVASPPYPAPFVPASDLDLDAGATQLAGGDVVEFAARVPDAGVLEDASHLYSMVRDALRVQT